MAAEPILTSRWPVPPDGGYRFDDLFRLPELPKHTELLDGGLVFVAPQSNYHSLLVEIVSSGLRAAAPDEVRVRREMIVRFSDRTALEPDVVVVGAGAVTSPAQASFETHEVLLAVEVMSPSSIERDRDLKPHLYAGAGIAHYWRIEWTDPGKPPFAFLHRLGEGGRYVRTAVLSGRLVAAEPFPVEIDLTEVDRL